MELHPHTPVGGQLAMRRRACLGGVGQALFGLWLMVALVFISLPIVALAWRSAETGAWAEPLDERVRVALWLTLRTSTASIGAVALLGTPLAYMLAFRRFWGKNALETLVELPVILPPSVAGLGLLMAFGRRGLLGPLLEELFGWRIPFTMAAVVLAQTFVALPFYVRAGQLGFQAIDPELQNAARVDGASALARFVYITLPLARRALLAGLLMSWARALGEFGATILFAGSLSGRTQTLSLLIYNIFEQDIGAAVWTALLMIALAAGLLVLARILAGAERST